MENTTATFLAVGVSWYCNMDFTQIISLLQSACVFAIEVCPAWSCLAHPWVQSNRCVLKVCVLWKNPVIKWENIWMFAFTVFFYFQADLLNTVHDHDWHPRLFESMLPRMLSILWHFTDLRMEYWRNRNHSTYCFLFSLDSSLLFCTIWAGNSYTAASRS